MADEVHTNSFPGLTVYFVVYNQADQIWNPATLVPAFENKNTTHWTLYAVPMTETSPGSYLGDLPSSLPAGNYVIIAYCFTGIPLSTDPAVAVGTVLWNGHGEVTEQGFTVSVGLDTGELDTINIISGVEDDVLDPAFNTGVSTSNIPVFSFNTGIKPTQTVSFNTGTN